MVCYHQKYMILHDLISQSTTLYCQYWGEYLKAQPGNIIINKLQSLRTLFNRISDINAVRANRGHTVFTK